MGALASNLSRQLEPAIGNEKLLSDVDTGFAGVEKAVHLTGKEYRILELLNLHKGTAVTKEMFLKHLYPDGKEPEMKIIDVFVCKIRKKLAEATGNNHGIETVWGRGYMLRGSSLIAPTAHPDSGQSF